MRLLDLFCGVGGAGAGYAAAGFEVVGVDLKPQPHYPFAFHQGDALEYLAAHWREYDAFHASPPCQAYCVSLNAFVDAKERRAAHPHLIEPTRAALKMTGRPYIIENVMSAPLWRAITLCGEMFDLRVFRHRAFELCPRILWAMPRPRHRPHRRRYYIQGRRPPSDEYAWTITGHFGGTVKEIGEVLGIPWAKRSNELAQAIPPAYTEYLGRHLLKVMAA